MENAGVHQLTIETRTPAFRALRMGHDPVGITCTTLSNLEGPLWEIRDNRKHWPAAFIQDRSKHQLVPDKKLLPLPLAFSAGHAESLGLCTHQPFLTGWSRGV